MTQLACFNNQNGHAVKRLTKHPSKMRGGVAVASEFAGCVCAHHSGGVVSQKGKWISVRAASLQAINPCLVRVKVWRCTTRAHMYCFLHRALSCQSAREDVQICTVPSGQNDVIDSSAAPINLAAFLLRAAPMPNIKSGLPDTTRLRT